MPICLSHGGTAIYDSEKFSSEVWVATQDGISVIQESGRRGAWREARRTLEGHHVCALLQEAQSGRYFAGTHDAGIAVSDDGEHWQFQNKGLENTNVFSLATIKTRGKPLVYAGTEPAALFVSVDLGGSWQRLTGLDHAAHRDTWAFPAPPFQGHVKSIAVNADDPDQIYICVEQGGLYSTQDGGKSWTEHTEGMPNDTHRVVLHPSRHNRIYVSNGFFFNRSDDGGRSWHEMASKIRRIGYADPLVYHPRKPDLMFVAGAFATPDTWIKGSANSSVSRTRDGGDTWQDVRGGFPDEILPSFEAGCIEACGDQSQVFLGDTHGEVWMTADEGEQWTCIVKGIPPVSKCLHADLIHGKLKLGDQDIKLPEELRQKMAEMVAREG